MNRPVRVRLAAAAVVLTAAIGTSASSCGDDAARFLQRTAGVSDDVAEGILNSDAGVEAVVRNHSENTWFKKIVEQWDHPTIDAACTYVTDYPGAWPNSPPELAPDQVAEWTDAVEDEETTPAAVESACKLHELIANTKTSVEGF